MTLWTDIFNRRHLISRLYYKVPGTVGIVVPLSSAYARFSAVGAGGYPTGSWGAGAAFARTKCPVTPGESINLQVGDIAGTATDPGLASGDSIVTRVTGSVVLCKADRARAGTPGSAANCIGDVKRSGLAGFNAGGTAAGDEGDPFELGFGGRGAAQLVGSNTGGGQAVHGGGGQRDHDIGYGVIEFLTAGYGMICAEFFDIDPGY